MNDLDNMIHDSIGNPISALNNFLKKQKNYEAGKLTSNFRFVGYVLELGFENARIITSDPYKIAVGGIPRGSFLIMVPQNFKGIVQHFTLLRVNGVSDTPLSSQVQQTYFELHKKSMPEIDVWTQSELQWGALDCDVLGMFYPNPDNLNEITFSGDVNNVVSAHKYKVYSPDEELLNIIVNSLVRNECKVRIGSLRTMECKLNMINSISKKLEDIPVEISIRDFMGCRTAMFGKTRLGKSNVVNLIMQGVLDATDTNTKYKVGQLVFDINGEYANDNEQNKSIRSANEKRCFVYALTERNSTPSKILRLNFYEHPEQCMSILSSLLNQDGKSSNYVRSFASVIMPSINEAINKSQENYGRSIRAKRKILIYWAILNKAGFEVDEKKLLEKGLNFNMDFSKFVLKEVYNDESKKINSLSSLTDSLVKLSEFIKDPKHELKSSSDNKEPLFDSDDLALLKFLNPSSTGSGPSMLKPYNKYHSDKASNFIKEILQLLDEGKTVILDLGNANDEIRKYFSEILSVSVFSHQEEKFVNDKLGNNYIELYFEEAHNLFPPDGKDLTGVYARFAKEGAKFHIGMVYSTQSPSTINKELLVQTENFFVGHLSSEDETRALSRLQVAFKGIEKDILRSKTVGYMRMLTLSHRFVISVQADRYNPK
ncbi:TPA: ATP-binding protein [Clostridioides difficile]|nr:DUF87 domain-containing protein [Clostridioides difficile]HBF5147613.1 ATP-binding protein [Clostridioides difficile]HBF6468920.1 ATP-binding protein [Clostridioides difficile]HBH3651468.1 ATP-binding protein [Clostridioides difficile]HDO9657120.1 ATP-binding protein [Clostridioides difficile]